MAPVIEDARRRQQRRRRTVAIGIACLAVSAGAAIFGSRQFRAPSHTAGSTTLAKGASTSTTYNGMTLRGRGTGGQMAVVPNFKVRSTRAGFYATVVVALNPTTGAVEVRPVNRPKP